MKKDNNKGFTFIELVLYMGILAIFMVAVTNLMGSVTASNRKMTTRKKVQTMASETYESVSDMFMGAVDVKIYGTAYISVTNDNATSYSEVTGVFLVPESDYTKEESTGKLIIPGGTTYYTEEIDGVSKNCYDIADIKSFGDVDSPSTDTKTYITADSNGLMYVYIKYASDIDSSNSDKNSIYTCCTLKYDAGSDKIYISRVASTDTSNYAIAEGKFVIGTEVFCKYVSDFYLQVNPDEDSFAVTLDLEDSDTAVSYDVNGVVSLRNSYVLKAHSWN